MANKTFIFQTGHAKELAKAELQALLGPSSITDEVFDGWVVEAELPGGLMDKLGGIVRITEVLQSGPARMPLNFEEWVSKGILENVSTGGKIRFGLSMHPKSEKILKKILNNSKKNLKSQLGNVRYVNKDFQNLSSVQAWHENLVGKENSIELHLFQGETKWYLSKTLAIQNFEWYSKRDYERPARSAKNGMFPPKLAQILINLAEPKPGSTIYDPFCGSGTVLQEAWLMGLPSQGSDLAQEMVLDSQKNLDWLQKQSLLPGPLPNLFLADATKLTASDLPPHPFAIVTETWLGPLLTKPPSPMELPKIQREVEALYEAFFSNLKQILTKPITVVFTAPFHREGNQDHLLPNLPEILARHAQIIPLSEGPRPSLFFERKQQIVGREIWKIVCGPL